MLNGAQNDHRKKHHDVQDIPIAYNAPLCALHVHVGVVTTLAKLMI